VDGLNLTDGLTVLIGPPGSGKTTWRLQHAPAAAVLCLDEYRARVLGDATDQTRNAELVAMMHRDLARRLAAGLPVVVDATSTLPAHRAELLGPARRLRRPARAVVFRTPLRECLRRNTARERTVPERVIEIKHAEVAKLTRQALTDEGFADVVFLD
jgi:predicted kinase